MVKKLKARFKVGDVVRLDPATATSRSHVNTTSKARIARFYDDIPGGVKLDKPLGGFYFWNVADLVHAK
jgi:hypothetical protein